MNLVSYENNILVLSCRDEYSMNLVKGKELDSCVKNAVKMVSGVDTSVMYIVEGDNAAAINSIVSETKVKEKERQNNPNSGLTDEFTFENFIVGDCNRFAYASAFSVAENPGLRQKNPLYLWGNSGLGKTHLMKAVGYKVKQLFPNKKVLYTTCEEFTNAYIACMNNKAWDDFRNKYRNIDVLLIDDIQFLQNKPGTQEEVFHTFNELHSSNIHLFNCCFLNWSSKFII